MGPVSKQRSPIGRIADKSFLVGFDCCIFFSTRCWWIGIVEDVVAGVCKDEMLMSKVNPELIMNK